MKVNINYIKTLLKKENMNITELGLYSGIPAKTLYNLSRGYSKNPSFFVIVRLMRYFNITNIEEFVLNV